MTIKTKFDLYQHVWVIWNPPNLIETTCKLCGGSERVNITNSKRTVICPDCYGRGAFQLYGKHTWKVHIHSIIGKIDIEKYYKPRSDDDKIRYMLEETGIGSGTLYDEENVFETEDEAIAECNRRNNEEESRKKDETTI